MSGIKQISAQSRFPSQFADGRLGLIAHRKQDAVQQIRVDAKQHVALVLPGVQTAQQLWFLIVVVRQPGIVAGGDIVCSHRFREVPEMAELQPVVAHHAGIGRATGQVFVRKVVLDTSESVLEIHGVKRDVQCVGNSSRVGRVGRAAAPLFVRWCVQDRQVRPGHGARFRLRRARPHEQPNDVEALFAEQHGSCRTVDSAAHCQHNTCHGVIPEPLILARAPFARAVYRTPLRISSPPAAAGHGMSLSGSTANPAAGFRRARRQPLSFEAITHPNA